MTERDVRQAGAWRVGSGTARKHLIYDADGWLVGEARRWHRGRYDGPAATRNARLMAAAPDLLAACKAVLAECVENAGGDDPTVHPPSFNLLSQLTSAIAKATATVPA